MMGTATGSTVFCIFVTKELTSQGNEVRCALVFMVKSKAKMGGKNLQT